ncbi:MAG TPA: LPS export ABC transporter permease LptG [Coxiellaceae bacterium]|nr:LPS export ABC transporter permease LptG [Coxiellaceae bacterium]
MTLIDRHLIKSIILATLLVLAILVAVEIFVGLVTEMSSMGAGNYGFGKALLYVLFYLPTVIYELFPTACLMGSLLGLGRLAMTNELIIIRATGFSLVDVMKTVTKAMAIFVLVIMVVGEMIAPSLANYAQQLKNQALGEMVDSSTAQGIWLKQNNMMIHIDQLISSHEFEGFTSYQVTSDGRIAQILFAKEGLWKEGLWHLMDVKISHFEKDRVVSETKQDVVTHLNVKPDLLGLDTYDYDRLSLWGLFQSFRYRNELGLNASHIELTFWQRLYQPLTALVMICLGIPFVFSSLQRVNIWGKLILGGLIGFGFFTLNQLVGRLSLAAMIPPLLAAIIPTLFFGVICVMLMRRAN